MAVDGVTKTENQRHAEELKAAQKERNEAREERVERNKAELNDERNRVSTNEVDTTA